MTEFDDPSLVLGLPDPQAELMDRIRAAVRTPDLILRLDRNIFGGRALVHLLRPGATPRSRPVPLCPVLVGDEGQSHSDLLAMVAQLMQEEGR